MNSLLCLRALGGKYRSRRNRGPRTPVIGSKLPLRRSEYGEQSIKWATPHITEQSNWAGYSLGDHPSRPATSCSWYTITASFLRPGAGRCSDTLNRTRSPEPAVSLNARCLMTGALVQRSTFLHFPTCLHRHPPWYNQSPTVGEREFSQVYVYGKMRTFLTECKQLTNTRAPGYMCKVPVRGLQWPCDTLSVPRDHPDNRGRNRR